MPLKSVFFIDPEIYFLICTIYFYVSLKYIHIESMGNFFRYYVEIKLENYQSTKETSKIQNYERLLESYKKLNFFLISILT